MDPLLTDLYQLNMMASYVETGMTECAVFEFFVRKLPETRGFLMAAGLEQALEYLENLRFTQSDVADLRRITTLPESFFEYLRQLRFTGDVHAMPEGSVFFANEPILRITAPLPQAQFVETRLINLLHFQTIVASKAARCVLAAPGKSLVDFGMRRAHGAEAGLLAARAAYIAGFSGTATILAGVRFGVPLRGTMAHSFIQAHDSETEAFVNFARSMPKGLVLLIDTYDTELAARNVVELSAKLSAIGIRIEGVRIDSGDLALHARRVRDILDAGGLQYVKIVASGGLDEMDLRRFEHGRVPIDTYGIGTSLTTSADAPYLDCAYKLQEYAGRARRKKSEGKETWPGRKQVWRSISNHGYSGDLIGLEGNAYAGEPLLMPVMRNGRRVEALETIDRMRVRAAENLARLPEALRQLEAWDYPAEIGADVRALAHNVDEQLGRSRQDVGEH